MQVLSHSERRKRSRADGERAVEDILSATTPAFTEKRARDETPFSRATSARSTSKITITRKAVEKYAESESVTKKPYNSQVNTIFNKFLCFVLFCLRFFFV